jgi:hypothetical protein
MYKPKLLLQTLTQLQHILKKRVRENKLAPFFFKKALILKVKQICNKLQYCITPITTLGISTIATYIFDLAPVSKKRKKDLRLEMK